METEIEYLDLSLDNISNNTDFDFMPTLDMNMSDGSDMEFAPNENFMSGMQLDF